MKKMHTKIILSISILTAFIASGIFLNKTHAMYFTMSGSMYNCWYGGDVGYSVSQGQCYGRSGSTCQGDMEIGSTVYDWGRTDRPASSSCLGVALGAPSIGYDRGGVDPGENPDAGRPGSYDIIHMVYWDKNNNGTYDEGVDRSIMMPIYALGQGPFQGVAMPYYDIPTTHNTDINLWENSRSHLNTEWTGYPYDIGISQSSNAWTTLIAQGFTTTDPITETVIGEPGVIYYTGLQVGLHYSCTGGGSKTVNFIEYSCPNGYTPSGSTCILGSDVIPATETTVTDTAQCNAGAQACSLDGTISNSFDPGVGFNGSIVDAAPQPDGKVILGGGFTSYKGTTSNRVIRVNLDGSIDTSFDIGTGFNSTVIDMALQPNGKLLVGGVFTAYNGTTANRIIRLNSNGSVDSTFNIGNGFNDGIEDVILQADGKIIVGGEFTAYNGTTANHIIRLNSNGSVDSTFNIGNGFNNTVQNIIFQPNGGIIIGGDFTTYNGTPANHIIRLNSNGSVDSTFNVGNGFNDGIIDMVLQPDGKLLIGGQFTAYNGVSANRIIRLNTDGSRDNSFNIGNGFNNLVIDVQLIQNGKVVLGGSFTSFDGTTTNRVARLNADGTLDTTFNIGNGFNDNVQDTTLLQNGQILVDGIFTSFDGTTANRIALINSVNACEVQLSCSIALDGTTDSSFNMGSGFSNYVKTTAIQSDGKILVGGSINSYSGNTVNKIIRLNSNGLKDTSFNVGSGFNNDVTVIGVQADGKVLVGGYFTGYNGTTANRIIRLNTDGSVDGSFNAGGTGFAFLSPGSYPPGYMPTVDSMKIQADGKILIGGSFTAYNGAPVNSLIRLNIDGSMDTSFNNGGTGFGGGTISFNVRTISIQADGKIIAGGNFTSYNGTTANRIVRLNTDGSMDTSFNNGGSGFSGGVQTTSIQADGKIVVGGTLLNYNGTAAPSSTINNLIRLNTDGSVDSTFNTNNIRFNNSVSSTALQADGKILVGGGFTSYNGTSNYIVRLNTNGDVDTSFDIGSGFNSTVATISIQADGKIIAGGGFTTYNGNIARKLMRINSSNITVTQQAPTVCDLNDALMAGICYIPGEQAGSTFFVSSTNGRVGVNTENPAYTLDVNGTMRASQILTISDARLKSSIEKIDSALEKIRQINGYSFNWKKNGKPDLGVLAQEIEKVFTDAVRTDVDGSKTVQYNALLAPIIEAIHELNTQIDSLYNEKFTEQEKRIEAIENKVK